ncbi:MAG: hypothetical protein ACK4OM_03910 [Alphaproteobacteria bacterium]
MNILTTQIIAEAKTWLGTSFHHQGRVKKTGLHNGGCDCIGLILGIAKSLNLKSNFDKSKLLIEFDKVNYKRIVIGNDLKNIMSMHFIEIDLDHAEICDIVLFNINKNLQHIGMIIEKNQSAIYVIHSYIQAKQVVMHNLDEEWINKIDSVYRFADLV